MNTHDVDRIAAEETEASEAGRDLDAAYVPNHYRPKQPSQVYSVRLPVDRLEELRVLARARDITPSALLRRLVIEALDRAAETASRIAETSEEIPPKDRDSVVVLTREQLIGLMAETARLTAERMAPIIRADIARSIRDELADAERS